MSAKYEDSLINSMKLVFIHCQRYWILEFGEKNKKEHDNFYVLELTAN